MFSSEFLEGSFKQGSSEGFFNGVFRGGARGGIFNLFMESLGVFLFNYVLIIHSNFVLLSLLAVARNYSADCLFHFLQDAFSGCQILPCSHKVHRECAIAMIQNGM